MNPVDLSVFASRVSAVCDEMGAVLQRSSFSPNIKDRLDFSCAVFDAEGALCAQAAHIPVHLGSMAYAMAGIVRQVQWHPGDMVILNDPYLGGTHLPDVTVIAPVFHAGVLVGFVANRAHHADIGAESPGSMPISERLDQEGLVIAPARLLHRGAPDERLLEWIAQATRDPRATRGDFAAQVSANRTGVRRLEALVQSLGGEAYGRFLAALNDYAERLARSALTAIPPGEYRFRDYMDDDGLGTFDIPIEVCVRADGSGAVEVDFTGTAGQVRGNINCPLPVAAAGVYYVFRCLMPSQMPAAAGSFRPIRIVAPEGCLLNARRPAAVAAGNVETSTRVVDAVTGALAQALPDRIPAASHGSMNNLALGARGEHAWDYYETIGGGMGAGSHADGTSAVQTHMTNTLNTPVEVLEGLFPLRVTRYQVRPGSGGAGRHRGGDGIVREFRFLAPAQATLLTERRRHAPWGLAGGCPGAVGANFLNDRELPAKVAVELHPGDRLRIETPGGGGWGTPPV